MTPVGAINKNSSLIEKKQQQQQLPTKNNNNTSNNNTGDNLKSQGGGGSMKALSSTSMEPLKNDMNGSMFQPSPITAPSDERENNENRRR